MIRVTPADGAMVKELIAILDEEIDLLNRKNAELDRLSAATMDRNDEEMVKLLVEMDQTHQAQAATDVKLDALRKAFADRLDRSLNQMRLADLIDALDEPDKLTVEYRRNQIVLLAEKLRRQYMTTAMVLRESARINQVLLEGLFPKAQPVQTYDANGPSTWRPDTGLLEAEM